MAGKGWGIYLQALKYTGFENTWSVSTLDSENKPSAKLAREATSLSVEVLSALTSAAVTQGQRRLSMLARGHAHAVFKIDNAR